MDAVGSVVGVATGAIPQNVNFAVNAGTVRAFLDAEQVPYETIGSGHHVVYGNGGSEGTDVHGAYRMPCWPLALPAPP